MDDLVYSSCQPFAWRCHHTREKQSRVGGKWLVLSVIANVALLLLYVSELSRTHTQAVSQNSAFGTESSTAIWGDTRNLRGKQITDLNSVAGSIDAEFHISRRRYLQEPGDDDQGSGDDKPTYQVALEFSAVVVLVFTSGLFSGLTLGLMGLETNQLRYVSTILQTVKDAGSPEERVYASRIWPVREKGNLLLCTLLLGNVGVNAILSILLADIAGGLIGFLVSTAAITIFGEIIPQAACSRYALSKPLSMVLDKVLGEEVGKLYSKEEFDKLIQSHTSTLSEDRRRIMQGALNYGEAKTCEIMTPIEDTFSLTSDQRLNFDVMLDIFENGYSRIPVWDVKRENLIGLLYSKDLILLTPREEVPVVTVLSFFHREYIPVLDENDTLEKALRILNSEKVHFAAVRGVDDSNEDLDPVYRIIGCITLEDILEQILQMNVEDEHDIEIESLDTSQNRAKTFKRDKRIVDRQRLKIFDFSGFCNNLPIGIVRAAASTLQTFIPIFQDANLDGYLLNFNAICRLIRRSQVLRLSHPDVSKRSNASEAAVCNNVTDSSRAKDEDMSSSFSEIVSEEQRVLQDEGYICRRHDELSAMFLILEGAVLVRCGDDNIMSTKRSFDIFGERLFSIPSGQAYVVDFSAQIASQTATLLRIKRSDVERMLKDDMSYNETAMDIDDDPVTSSEGTFTSLAAVTMDLREQKDDTHQQRPSYQQQQQHGDSKDSRDDTRVVAGEAPTRFTIEMERSPLTSSSDKGS